MHHFGNLRFNESVQDAINKSLETFAANYVFVILVANICFQSLFNTCVTVLEKFKEFLFKSGEYCDSQR